MAQLIPDRFVLMLIATLALAWVFPVRGNILAVMQDAMFAGIFLLFFLHGLRLPRREVANAARGWRVQAAMLLYSFGVMPIAGWALAQLAAPALPAILAAGIIYLSVLPSTVQSAVSYSSIGGGNVAASVVGAAISNLAAILLTPMLVILLIGGVGGIAASSSIVIKIATMLLLPFAMGQAAQHWLGAWAVKQKALLSLFDRGVILLAVYIAFAGAVASGVLMQVSGEAMIALGLTIAIMLSAAFGGAMLLGIMLGLARKDLISLLFAGAHKSIAAGAPMAALLFGEQAGLIILPAILYHMAQLIVSAPIAAKLSKAA